MSDEKPSLSLVEPQAFLKDLKPRNYWNTVGQNKEFFPTQPRPESIPTLNKQGRVIEEPEDEWWINSKEHNYCFWSFVRDHSQPDGTMEPLLQSDIAKLFGCSSTKVHFMIKEAMDRLMSDENMKILQDMFNLTEDEPGEESISFGTLSQLEQNDEDDEA